MIVALYGQSSSGKTTIANALRRQMKDCATRHCGEVVKTRAQKLHTLHSALSQDEHRVIDAGTRTWCEAQQGVAIVEGRYLHWVLSQSSTDFRLIELICSETARKQRWAQRMGRPLKSDELSVMDEADRGFATEMYRELSPLVPALRLDTTFIGVSESVQQILTWLDQPSLR